MHDGGGNREQDIEALPAIIDGLRDAGYTLVTVSELMELDGTFPQDVVQAPSRCPRMLTRRRWDSGGVSGVPKGRVPQWYA